MPSIDEILASSPLAGLKPAGVAARDAVGARRMLMEWYASDTARASVRDQLAPLEKLGPAPRRDGDPDAGGLSRQAGIDHQDRAKAAPAPQRGGQPAAGHNGTAGDGSRRPRSAARPPARMSRTAAGLTGRSGAAVAAGAGALPVAAPACPGSSRAAQTAFPPVPRMVHPQATASAPTICRPWPDSASGSCAATAGGAPVGSVITQVRRLA